MFDYTLLGMRAFEAMRAAAMSGAIAPDARIIPRKAAVWAVLLELRLANVSGFDLSAMNAYRWHPIAEGVDLEHEPHRRLSEPVPVCDIDFQRWLDVCIAGGGAEGLCGDAELEVTMTGGGVWNAVAMWFDLDVSGETVTSQAGASWTPAVYFVDERPVSAGDITQLRVRHDTAHFIVESVPVQTRPRHSIVPTWHFDMLNDAMRNDAYERAIQRAVQRRKATHGEVRAACCAHMCISLLTRDCRSWSSTWARAREFSACSRHARARTA
jgi:protein arginine N-methyltransferase 7